MHMNHDHCASLAQLSSIRIQQSFAQSFCFQAKLERRVKMVEVTVLNQPRQGKKLLVVDIDYTIFDLGSTAETPNELARCAAYYSCAL